MSDAVATLGKGAGIADDYTSVLQSLEAAWARDAVVQRQQLEEAARALRHAEQRNLLAERWSGEFLVRMQDMLLPDWVSSFLRGPWAQVVAADELACKDGRSDPRGYVELVDELLWSVQAKKTRRNRPRLVSLVPGLLVKLRQGLQSIDFPADRWPLIFDALLTEHEKAFDGPRISEQTGEDGWQAAPIADAMLSLDSRDVGGENDEAIGSGYVSSELVGAVSEPFTDGKFSARDLRVGVWVELIVKGHWLRAQLTWVSPHRTLFMFVARGGSAHSMSRRTMKRLRLCMQGAIRVVSEGHLVDKALDAVAQAALRNESTEGESPSCISA